MAQIINATIYGSNGNDWNQPSGVSMGFPTKNIVFKSIPPTPYSGIICNSEIQILPTAPSPIQVSYYTNELVNSLVDAANSDVNYPVVDICNQEWMDKNWEGITFRNGDVIPEVTDQSTWAGLTTPAWCYYDNDPANGAIYGKLYNWYAVSDPRGLAPVGWRVPTGSDLDNIQTCLGADAGGKMKETGTAHWNSPNTGATNESGFTALPGGITQDPGGGFSDINFIGAWWSQTEADATSARVMFLLSNESTGDFSNQFFKNQGLSVRLLKDI